MPRLGNLTWRSCLQYIKQLRGSGFWLLAFVCLAGLAFFYSLAWQNDRPAGSGTVNMQVPASLVSKSSLVLEMKLMYGLIFSLKSFVQKLSPTDCKEGFLSYQTSKYRLNFYETASGLKFIMNTDVGATNVRDLLQKIYKEIYVEYVVKNPECKLGKEIISEVFQSRLDKFVRSSPLFTVRMT